MTDKRPKRKDSKTTPRVQTIQEPSLKGDRIAKVIARAGLCSRREAEAWIGEGRVKLNGRVLTTPAMTVGPRDKVEVDDAPLPTRERTRLWLYHKPRGLVTTTKDPEGRPTVFSRLPKDLPRVLSVGRLDINTEGLLLLTNDGGLARVLELPTTGWLRRYRVRAHGRISQEALDKLTDGIAIDGVLYGAIEATLERQVKDNCWLNIGLREGKNREIKKVLEHLGLQVGRLIRVSFGPFQLADLETGDVREIRGRVLRDQLGSRLIEASGADFDSPLKHDGPKPAKTQDKAGKSGKPSRGKPGFISRKAAKAEMARKSSGGAKPAPRPRRKGR